MHNYRRFIDSILTHNPARAKTQEKADGYPIITQIQAISDSPDVFLQQVRRPRRLASSRAHLLGNTYNVVFSDSVIRLFELGFLIPKPTLIQFQSHSFNGFNTLSHPYNNALTVARGLK